MLSPVIFVGTTFVQFETEETIKNEAIWNYPRAPLGCIIAGTGHPHQPLGRCGVVVAPGPTRTAKGVVSFDLRLSPSSVW